MQKQQRLDKKLCNVDRVFVVLVGGIQEWLPMNCPVSIHFLKPYFLDHPASKMMLPKRE
jgi:hypothetical protein